MIGKLKGSISEIHGNEALFETQGGVFYRVFVTPDLASRKQSRKTTEIYTYTHVREDDITLFGFKDYDEYRIFTYLIAIDGVGPKTGFSIVCLASPAKIRAAVLENDVSFFQAMKGIGKKTAQRILIDLSATFGSEFDITAGQETQEDTDAIDALVALGFKRKDARTSLDKIDKKLPLNERITLALQKVSRG